MGAGAEWALEFRDADSPWRAKRWVHDWGVWADGLEMVPTGQQPMYAQVRALDAWVLVLRFEREGQVIASSYLQHSDHCFFQHRDDKGNVILFYRW